MTDAPESSIYVRHRYLVLLAAGVLAFGFALGNRGLWYPDEPDIGEVAQAMFHSGDWIAPRRTGEIWVDYPPFLYWASCAFSHLFGGMSEFTLRLPSALAGLLLALATCQAGSRWFNARVGWWAGIVLLTFSQFWLNAVGHRTDVLFSLFIGVGVLVYAAACEPDRPRWGGRLAAFVLFGLAVLTKGPLGVLLPGLALFLWHGARREWRPLLELAPLAAVSFVIYLPWFVACADAMGADSIVHEFWAQNFERFASSDTRGHGYPWHYYLTRIWADLAIWSPLVPFAVWWLVRSGRWREPRITLLLWWFGATVVFLSMAATKRQVYLIPAYPAAALLLALWLDALDRQDPAVPGPDPRPASVFAAVLAIALPIGGVLGLVAVAAMDPVLDGVGDRIDELVHRTILDVRWPIALLAVVAAGCGIWVLRGWRRDRTAGGLSRTLERVALVQIPIYLVVSVAVLPVFDPLKSYASEGRWIREHVAPEATHFALFYPGLAHHKRGAFQYYAWPLQIVWAREGTDPAADGGERSLRSEDDLLQFFDQHPGGIALVHEDSVPMFMASSTVDWRARVVDELVASRRRYTVFRGP